MLACAMLLKNHRCEATRTDIIASWERSEQRKEHCTHIPLGSTTTNIEASCPLSRNFTYIMGSVMGYLWELIKTVTNSAFAC